MSDCAAHTASFFCLIYGLPASWAGALRVQWGVRARRVGGSVAIGGGGRRRKSKILQRLRRGSWVLAWGGQGGRAKKVLM